MSELSINEVSISELSRDELSAEFSKDVRALLLRLAHDSILSALEQREIPLDPPTPHLSEPRGAFTSLYLRGVLRGCVGYVLPVSPVYRAVADTARAAAFEDTRFHPVTLSEARDLEIELSILSPPQPISAEAVKIGRHGLLITLAGHRGLLLPQVPTEYHWDRTDFPRTNLPQSRSAPECVAKRRNHRSLHRRSFSGCARRRVKNRSSIHPNTTGS